MSNKKSRVLIVDDNPSIHEDLKHILVPKTFTGMDKETLDLEDDLFNEEPVVDDNAPLLAMDIDIDHAYQGLEAIEKVNEAVKEGNPYALILMDVRMPPGLDGIQTIKRIWDKYPKIEMIICTAFSDYSWDKIVENLGSTDNLLFVKKPFDSDAIRQTIHSVLKRMDNTKKDSEIIERLEKEVESRKSQLAKMISHLETMKIETETELLSNKKYLPGFDYEFRTPMHGIMGMTDLLLDTNLDEDQRDYAETIKASSDSLFMTINDVLDYSRLIAGAIELNEIEFNLRTLVEELADYISFSMNSNEIEIATIIQADVPEIVIGDPTRVRQILLNLATNAVKCTETGEITISISQETNQPLQVSAGEKNQKIILHFEVSDTGSGIAPEFIDNLFLSEGRSDQVNNNKGIGLVITKQLTELMGGTIGVKSRTGNGSTFCFTAPFEFIPSSISKYSHSSQTITGLNCLIVGNNATSRKVISLHINQWGAKVDEASTRDIAIEKLDTAMNLKAFDIVIVDFKDWTIDDYIDFSAGIYRHNNLKKAHLVCIMNKVRRGDSDTLKQHGYSALLTKPLKQNHLFECLLILKESHGEDSIFEYTNIITNPVVDELNVGQKKILVVEDNYINQKVVARMLKKLNIRCDIAKNGQMAVSSCKTKNYDMIFMDCIMPVMDGYEATKLIRKNNDQKKHIPIIAITAETSLESKKKCFDSGMDDYVLKPFTLEKIKSILGKWF